MSGRKEESQISIMMEEFEEFAIDEEILENLVFHILKVLHLEAWELSISLVSSEEIRSLNKQYRFKDKSTDVLSFPQSEWTPALLTEQKSQVLRMEEENPHKILGDLVICLEEASKNAQNIGQDLDRELCFLLIHGILHLCGHDHMEADEEKLMIGEQKKLINLMNTATPLWENCTVYRK